MSTTTFVISRPPPVAIDLDAESEQAQHALDHTQSLGEALAGLAFLAGEPAPPVPMPPARPRTAA